MFIYEHPLLTSVCFQQQNSKSSKFSSPQQLCQQISMMAP